MSAVRPHHLLSDNDLFYLRSILRNLDELREGSMKQVEANNALAVNRDWLDGFITRFGGPG